MANVKSKFKPGELVACIEPFVTSSQPGGPFSVSAGTRWRSDHPIVQACPDFFVVDGTPQDEIQRLRQAIYRDAEVDPPAISYAKPTPPLRDEDAVVHVGGSGEHFAAGDPYVKANSAAFVPVVPKGLKRRDALVALQTVRQLGADGTPEREVIAGQWIDRDDPLAAAHPHNWRAPAYETKGY